MSVERLEELGQALMLSTPGFLGLIIYIPRKYVDDDNLDIQTDGKIIKVGNKFFKDEVKVQAYKLLSGVCAVALRHNRRAYALRDNKELLKIWNISCGLIISSVLSDLVENNLIIEPKDLLTESEYASIFGKKEETAENYFKELADNKGSLPQEVNNSFISELINGEEYEDSNTELKNSGLASELENNGEDLQDTIWSQRVESSLAGTEPGSSVCRLLRHIKKIKTPWQQILQEYLLSRLRPEREPNWKRPSRRVLAGISEIYEPARDRKRGIVKLGLLIDLSGSCWDANIFTEFVSNVEKVLTITGAETTIITFDTRVQNIVVVPPHNSLSELLNKGIVTLTGGGGTDFIPAIAKIAEYNPEVVIGFTDCYGDFPPTCPKNIPFIWACLPNSGSAPWGKIIKLEK